MSVRSVALLACVGLFLSGCGNDEPAKTIDLSKRGEVTVDRPENAITYAYLPQYAHTVSYERHHLVIEYLSPGHRPDHPPGFSRYL